MDACAHSSINSPVNVIVFTADGFYGFPMDLLLLEYRLLFQT
jgi:hypothetical protein